MSIDPLARFEDSVQRLVEGGLARLFAGRLQAREVAVQIVRSMEDQTVIDESGQRLAPDMYTVRLNADDHYSILAEMPDLCILLRQELLKAAEVAGLSVSAIPQVRAYADPAVAAHQVFVSAAHSHHDQETTKSMDRVAAWSAEDNRPPDAHLLLDGERIIPITQPLVNVGRGRGNTIVLDDPAVSRHHAQIRLRFGHFTLFDLGSALGTQINGQVARQAMLRPGDVITIGHQTLIYIENSPSEPLDGDNTGPIGQTLSEV